MQGFDFCAWCGALTVGRDHEGDPACKDGEGCALARGAKPRRRGERGPNRGPITVRGVARTLKQWAEHFGVHSSTLITRAQGQNRTLEAEIDDRLEHGNPPHRGRKTDRTEAAR